MTKARDLANGGFGLVLIKPSTVVNGTDNGKGTVSFTTASSVSLNGVFSATYHNYVLQINFEDGSVSTALSPLLRMRVGGVSATGSNYIIRGSYVGDAVFDPSRSTSTSLSLTNLEPTTYFNGISALQIQAPFINKTTKFHWQSWVTGSTGIHFGANYEALHSVSASYDGIELLTSTGTMTGTVSIYGYNR